VEHGVVGLASRIFNGGKNIFSLQEGIIGQDFFIRSPTRQEIQDVGNAETKTANAGAASALSFFHRYSLQPFVAHKFEAYDGMRQRARPARLAGTKSFGQFAANGKTLRPCQFTGIVTITLAGSS
jgi:hypothetical protein